MAHVRNTDIFRWVHHYLETVAHPSFKDFDSYEDLDDQEESYAEEVVGKILRHVGQPEGTPRFFPERIGEGADAEVYWLANKRKVLKLTVSEDDAKALAYFKKHPDKGIVKVYDVFSIPDTFLYGIVMEKLTPSDKHWQEIAERISFAGRGGFFLSMKWFEGQLLPAIQKRRERGVGGPFMDAMTPENIEVIHHWCEVLDKAGIKWADMHDENVMFRGRQPVLMDLGRSTGATGRIPQMKAAAILEARKAQPIDGKIVSKKVLGMILRHFLTEKMYEEHVPTMYQDMLPYKRWKHENERAIADGVHYDENGPLVNVYTGTFFLDDLDLFKNFHAFLEKTVKGWGWYVLRANLPQQEGKPYSVDLAPNYGTLVEDVPPKLYHLALKEDLPSIRRKGLIPMKGREHGVTVRGYPDRVYFARSMNVVYDLHEGFLGRNYEEEGKYAVITIDTHKLRRGTKFYDDPEMPQGYSMWTYTHVPKEAILEVRDMMTEERLAQLVEARKIQPLSKEFVEKKLSDLIPEFLFTPDNYKTVERKYPDLFDYDTWRTDGIQYSQEGVFEHKNKVSANIGTHSLDPYFFKNLVAYLEPKLKGWGWYILSLQMPKDDYDFMNLQVAPNYGTQLKTPRYLYHITPKSNMERIKRKGFIPRPARQHGDAQRRQYPDRVYFGTQYSTVEKLYKEFVIHGEKESYVLFIVQGSRIPKNVKFYEDPEMPMGSSAWTYTHIPATAIVGMEDAETAFN